MSDKNEQKEVEETLSDLPVTEAQADDAKGGTEFSLNFQKIEYSYKPQKPDGTL